MSRRILCWFSAGAASAVATKLALREYNGEDIEVWYQDTGSEHPDNERFIAECQEWFGVEIGRMKSDKYADIWDVFAKTRWLAGVGGARCTMELKRKIAEEYLRIGDLEIFGYTADELARVDRFKENNPERNIDAILVRRSLTKDDCLAILHRQGIEIPAMYKLGYQNNNCIGCVKGQMGYWNKIRVDFPEVFARMAKVERELDAAICKEYVDGKRIRVFLDELDPGRGNYPSEPSVQCGILCEAEHQELLEADDE